jgi:hypothetical protein
MAPWIQKYQKSKESYISLYSWNFILQNKMFTFNYLHLKIYIQMHIN